jgi:Ca2+-binding EF-hand superfamily protein
VQFVVAHNVFILGRRLDADESGFITKGDIIDFLGENIPQRYIDDIMAEADLNHDNKISYREVSLLCL